MPHALVVGGTGMLATVSTWLAQQGYHVSVIGRDEKRLSSLVDQYPSNISGLKVDYHHDRELQEKVQTAIQLRGEIDLVVAWIHSTAPHALSNIMNEIRETTSKPWRLIHVCGSSSNLSELKRKVAPPELCQYQQVLLGFKINENISRWLTHEEIGNGIIDSIQSKREVIVVGTVTPWELRPTF